MASDTSIIVTEKATDKKLTHRSYHVGSPPTSFINPWPSYKQITLYELLTQSRQGRDFKPVPSREHLVQVQKPDWGLDSQGLKTTWLGHASFLIETPISKDATRGVRVLLDPVFSERTSPVSWAGPKRYSPTPCTLDELPDVDLVLISHDHYDHMDSATLMKIYARRKGNMRFLVGLGNASRFRGFGVDAEDVTELDWWESVHVVVANVGSINITCTPSQHGSGRGLMDQASTLWCSWVLEYCEGDDKSGKDHAKVSTKLFFAGDTGYRYTPRGVNDSEMPNCPVFKDIGATFGPFDLSLLPIGLYAPRHLLSSVHCNPEDALCLHDDLKSKKSIGMHYGTFRGGISQYFEEVTEPPRRFREACEKAGKVWGEELALMNIGETLIIP